MIKKCSLCGDTDASRFDNEKDTLCIDCKWEIREILDYYESFDEDDT